MKKFIVATLLFSTSVLYADDYDSYQGFFGSIGVGIGSTSTHYDRNDGYKRQHRGSNGYYGDGYYRYNNYYNRGADSDWSTVFPKITLGYEWENHGIGLSYSYFYDKYSEDYDNPYHYNTVGYDQNGNIVIAYDRSGVLDENQTTKLKSQDIMLNYFFKFANSSFVTPYIGLGTGLGITKAKYFRHTSDNYNSVNSGNVSVNQWIEGEKDYLSFLMGLNVGLQFTFNDNMAIVFDYAYTYRTGKNINIDVERVSGNSTKELHNVTYKLNYADSSIFTLAFKYFL